jgi:hypothetical protein
MAAMKSHGGKDLEVALDLRVHAGAVDDRTLGIAPVRLGDLHLFDGNRVADDVLGEPFQVLTLVGKHAATVVHVEPRMPPCPQHLGTLGRQQSLLHQERDHPCPE